MLYLGKKIIRLSLKRHSLGRLSLGLSLGITLFSLISCSNLQKKSGPDFSNLTAVNHNETVKKIKVLGQAIEGGVLIVKTPWKNPKIYWKNQEVKNYDGKALIGLQRDELKKAKLQIVAEDKLYTLPIKIKQRVYFVQKINNLNKKYVAPSKSFWQRIQKDSLIARRARKSYIKKQFFDTGFVMPAQGRFSGVYGSQRILNDKPKRPHLGWDIAAKTGTPVYADADGIITVATNMFYSGNTIFLDHGMGFISTFLHLDKILVKEGAQVKKGQKIALIGTTGRSTGPHLHWAMSVGNVRVDPQVIMGQKIFTNASPQKAYNTSLYNSK